MKLLTFFLLALAACQRARTPPTADVKPRVPLFEGIGEHKRKVTTASPEAQRYFDQGLNFVANFNHDEAIRSFAAAAEIDPECAMAYWGVAYANGPHYNLPLVSPDRAASAWVALAQAKSAKGKTPREEKLIAALASRYAEKQPEDRKALDEAYANAMRGMWTEAADDGDIGALFAESLMNLRPWDLYLPDGTARPETVEAVRTLETVLAKEPQHPFALHLLIHALEMSPTPEKADPAATALRRLTPGLGHLVHMPSHVDIRLGRWAQAIRTNVDAMAADKKYREQVPEQGFYRIYMTHNPHMRAFAAMMSGAKKEAIEVMDQAVADIPVAWAKEWAPFIDGFMVMPLEVRMRFGAWDEILAAPDLPEHFPISRALRHYVRAVALGAKGRLAEAREEQKLFLARRQTVAEDAAFGNNAAADLLAVADKLLEGELLVHEKRGKEAIAVLTAGVALEDRLRYDEPPDWIQPVRHTLGAALLQEGKWQEAEAVFRADLGRLPNNGWALSGLVRALEAQKKPEAKTIAASLASVWVASEAPPATSCLCLGSP